MSRTIRGHVWKISTTLSQAYEEGLRAGIVLGLRRAIRVAQREACWHEKHKTDAQPPAPPDWRSTCYQRAYIAREIASALRDIASEEAKRGR